MHSTADAQRIADDQGNDKRDVLVRDLLGGRNKARINLSLIDPDQLVRDVQTIRTELNVLLRELPGARYPLVHAQQHIALINKLIGRK